MRIEFDVKFTEKGMEEGPKFVPTSLQMGDERIHIEINDAQDEVRAVGALQSPDGPLCKLLMMQFIGKLTK